MIRSLFHVKQALVAVALAGLVATGCIPMPQPEGWSRPAIDGRDVYLATREGRIVKLTETADGAGFVETKLYPDGDNKLGHVYSNLLLNAGTLYGASYDGNLFAINLAAPLSSPVRPLRAAVVGDVALHGRLLLVPVSGTNNGRLLSFRLDSLDPVWETPPMRDGVWSGVAIEGGAGYFSGLDKGVHAVDLNGGQLQWRFTGEAGFVSTPAVGHGTVYVGGLDRRFYALGAGDGVPRWPAPFSEAQSWYWANPVLEGGRVYAPNLDGRVYALDAATGQKQWDYNTGGQIVASPVLVNGVLIVATTNGRLIAIDSSGRELARRQLEAGAAVRHDLAFANGAVYVVSINGGRLTLHKLSPGSLQGPSIQVSAN